MLLEAFVVIGIRATDSSPIVTFNDYDFFGKPIAGKLRTLSFSQEINPFALPYE